MTRSLYSAASKSKISYSFLRLQTNSKDLDEISALIEADKLKSVVKVFEGIERAPEALAEVEGGRATGKMVVKIA
jgi:NADPH-dependent curcumin reductase CurA